MITPTIEHESSRTLKRLVPRVEKELTDSIATDPQGWEQFKQRLQKNFPALFDRYLGLYGERYDFFFHLEDLLVSLARSWFTRAADLRELDQTREQDPAWFQSNQMLGGVCYVDLFAGDLAGIGQRIPYFKELGLTYLHLMPLFCAPQCENDGGYAISSYREVDPALGSVAQLTDLASQLRHNGISLV